MSTSLHIRSLSKRYGGPYGTAGLKHVDLDVRPGDFIAIVGTSGAGKSTLLNVIGLLDSYSTGRYEIGGIDAGQLSESERDALRSQTFSFVFQSSHLLPYETVEMNAALGLSVQGVARDDQERIVDNVLKQVGLSHRIGALARQLSGGERQRLSVARALSTAPSILLADEPTGSLDASNTASIMDLLTKLNAGGVTIVLITHDPDVARYAHRTVRIEDGVLQARSTEAGDDPRPAIATVSLKQNSLLQRISDALNAITSRASRSFALIAAFGLAVGGLVAALGIGASAAEQVAERLTQSALDELYVFNPETTTLGSLQSQQEAIEQLPHVVGTGLRINLEAADAGVQVLPTIGSSTAFVGSTIGLSSMWLKLSGVELSPSSAASLLDSADIGNIVIAGAGALEQLGFESLGPGREVWIAGRPFTLVGVVADSGRAPFLVDSLIVPVNSLPGLPSEILVRVEPGFPAAIADAIPTQLAPENPGTVSVSTVADLRQLRRGVEGDLATLIGVTGAILLVVAILSASTSMYLSVQARVQEIALRRAIGLSRKSTAGMFMIEGILLGGAGGLMGVALGLLLTVLIAALQGWSAVLPVPAIAVGLVAGLIGGVIAALVPAVRASEVEPAEAIR